MKIDDLGGRKFVLTVICVLAGIGVELHGNMSTQFASLLAALVTAFGAANAYNTKQALNSQEGSEASLPPEPTGSPGPTHGDLANIVSVAETAYNRLNETVNKLTVDLEQASNTALKAGELASNASQQVEQVSKLVKVALKVNG